MSLWVVVVSMVAAGVVGSVHCAAMCGAFGAAAGRSGWRTSLGYSLGRLTAYSLLGAVAGGLGAGLHAYMAGLSLASAGLAVIAGVLLAAVGLGSLRPPRGRVGAAEPTAWLYGRLAPLVRSSLGARRSDQAYVLGVLNGLLPCPVTTPLLLAAMASGSAPVGALLLAAAGAGTLPTMLTVGHAGGSGLRWLQQGKWGMGTTRLGGKLPGLAMLVLGAATAARPFLQAGASHMHAM